MKLGIIVSVCAVLLCGATSLQAATDIKAKVEGIPGNQCGNGEFDVFSFSFGANNSSSTAAGKAGLSTGKAQVSDLNLIKQFDACSPGLFQATVTGTHLPKLTLTQTEQDETGKLRTVLTIELTDVLVSSWSIAGAAGGGTPSESVSFNFAKVNISAPTSGAKFCWDLKSNTGCTN